MDPLGNCQAADNLASSSGFTDVETTPYNHSHGGGAFKSPAKPQGVFQEMSKAPIQAFKGDTGSASFEPGTGLSVNNCEIFDQMGDIPETVDLSPLDFKHMRKIRCDHGMEYHTGERNLHLDLGSCHLRLWSFLSQLTSGMETSSIHSEPQTC